MNAAVVRRTQEALGKVIRRPPLTEKLLSKPPFRYLHDIITEVIRITGFMKGLYTDAEMKSDNVKDKDAKISFLQKAIDVVVMVSGEPLSAKPARIVAGHEPERTNELLQMIGKCCLSKLSSEEAVKRVLAGEKGDPRGRAPRTSKVSESDSKNMKEEYSRSQEVRRSSGASSERRPKEEPKEDSKLREKSQEKAREGDRDRRQGERERVRAKARQDGDRDRGNKDREAEREAGKDKDRERRRAKGGEHAGDRNREKRREPDKPEKKSASSGDIPKKMSNGSKDAKAETEAEVPMGASRSLTSKTSKWRSKNSTEDDHSAGLRLENTEPDPVVKQKGDSPSDAGEAGPTGQDKPEVSENGEIPSELSSSLRRIPRPGSARPAPPRVRRQESTETLADRAGSGKTVSNVIIDSQNSDDEDDEQFVVEGAPQLSEMSEIEMVPVGDVEDEEKHGGLVKKILETKKDYEKLGQSPRPGEKNMTWRYMTVTQDEDCTSSSQLRHPRRGLRSTSPGSSEDSCCPSVSQA